MRNILLRYYRNFKKNPANISINIFGFSVSIAVVIVLVFYIIQEKGTDSSFKNLDNLYMVVTTKNESYVEENAKDIAITQFPQIVKACRYYNRQTDFVCNHNYYQGHLVTTDEDFFSVFACKFIYGDLNNSFINLNSIVLTESFSRRLFMGVNPIGQTVKAILGKEYTVTGVIEDLPNNSSIVADCFIDFNSKLFRPRINDIFINGLFIELVPGINQVEFAKQLSTVLADNSKILHNNVIDFGEPIEWKLRPFKTAYYDTSIENDQLKHANQETIRILSVIAAVILLLSIINFINLNTANNLSRIKEIGILKINGASKGKIIINFLIESIITCFIATIFAFLFAKALFRVFEIILSNHVEFVSFDIINVSIILLSIFLLGIISGISPAYFGSQYSPILLFNNRLRMSLKSKVGRNILISFQFTAAILLLICLVAFLKQLHFSRKRDVGFNTDMLVNIDLPDDFINAEVFSDYFRKNVKIVDFSFTYGNPMEVGSYYGSGKEIKKISSLSADSNFIRTFKLKLLLGRNIYCPSPIKECIITENAYKEAGWENLDNRICEGYKVVGVVNTFNSDDLHQQAPNIMITNDQDRNSCVTLRLNTSTMTGNLITLKSLWDKQLPDFGFRYIFYNDWKANSFIKEYNHLRIAFVFGVLSMILSCLGLYGLVSYSLKYRFKELGIRRIHGASIFQVFGVINLEYIRLVLFSFLFACPLAFFIIRRWLMAFSYKTTIPWGIYLLSGSLVFLLAIFTVLIKSYRIANANPVETIKYE